MSRRVPADLQEAAIQACGLALHWRARLEQIMLSAGVPESMYPRHNEPSNSKFVIARRILGELDQRDRAGEQIQQRIVEELLRLSKPDEDAPDQKRGQTALDNLRRVAQDSNVATSSERTAAEQRSRQQEQRIQELTLRAKRVLELKARFTYLHQAPDRTAQQRGYELEQLF